MSVRLRCNVYLKKKKMHRFFFFLKVAWQYFLVIFVNLFETFYSFEVISIDVPVISIQMYNCIASIIGMSDKIKHLQKQFDIQ